jgi:hypothetical protein
MAVSFSPYCEQALRAEPTGAASRRSNPTVALQLYNRASRRSGPKTSLPKKQGGHFGWASAALRADIASFIERHNRDPKPFKWTKSPQTTSFNQSSASASEMPRQTHDRRQRTFGSGH